VRVCVCVFDMSILIYDQAIKDDVGTIRIQRPHKGPFYVSPKSIDQLIMNLGKWAKYEGRFITTFSLLVKVSWC
jgi:hypothetical protein